MIPSRPQEKKNNQINPIMADVSWKAIENEAKILTAELQPNNLVKITFSDAQIFYYHPDLLMDLADEYADDEGVIYPLDEYEEAPEPEEENIEEEGTPDDDLAEEDTPDED